MAKKIPAFTYTGSCSTAADNTYWYIYFKSSGTFRLSNAKYVDLHLVGGGGSGNAGGSNSGAYCGGGGGYTTTAKGITVPGNTDYYITVGLGGVGGASNGITGNNGGSSAAFGYNAGGGYGGGLCSTGLVNGKIGGGGAGGSGGGARGVHGGLPGGNGGSDGSNGGDGHTNNQGHTTQGGYGQGRTTRDFGESWGTLRAGGGAGHWGSPGAGGGGTGVTDGENYQYNGGPGADGYGGGGGCGMAAHNGSGNPERGGRGGSGIVIIRGTQEDHIPVIFNGTRLERMIYNGVTITSLIYNGTKLFIRGLKDQIKAVTESARANSLCAR